MHKCGKGALSWSELLGDTPWDPFHDPGFSGVWFEPGGVYQHEGTKVTDQTSPTLPDSRLGETKGGEGHYQLPKCSDVLG